MLKRTSAFWLEALEKGDIPVQRMNSIDDIVADPHLKAIGYLKTVEHPSEGRIRMLAPPSEWSETPPEERRKYLTRIAEGLTARMDEIATLVSEEVGMVKSLSLMVQAGLPLMSFQNTAAAVALGDRPSARHSWR